LKKRIIFFIPYLFKFGCKGNHFLYNIQAKVSFFVGKTLDDVVVFPIDIIRSFFKLVFPSHQMAKGTEEFLRLLDDTQEYGHGFDVELAGLYVMNDALAVIGK